jgi:DNA-binding response OmpR family regulator
MEIKKILIISSDANLREVLSFCFDGWGYEVFLEESLSPDINLIKKISPDVIVIDVQAARKSQLQICKVLKDDFTTALIPIITIINKRQLREQLFNIRQGIDDYLIKPPDPLDLRIRIEMVIKRSQYSFCSSPLTGLPAGRLIEGTLDERIKKRSNFSFGHLDIDNFKYFNDVYGYLKGDRVIKHTAYMLYTTIREYGNSGDFIGHIGGDDFVFITSIDKYQAVSGNFIQLFDRIIPFHYTPQDRKKGFITARDRTHKVKEIPLMSMSLAVVNKTSNSDLKTVIEVNEKAAEIKRYLKTMPGSKFMADRRDIKSDKNTGPEFNRKKKRPQLGYKPLGQTLVEKNLISPAQLDEALQIHWEKGVVLGEVLKELGLLKDKELKEILDNQVESQEDIGK